jgi:hypothetical protein
MINFKWGFIIGSLVGILIGSMISILIAQYSYKPKSTVKIIYVDSLPDLGDTAVYVHKRHFPTIKQAAESIDAGEIITVSKGTY